MNKRSTVTMFIMVLGLVLVPQVTANVCRSRNSFIKSYSASVVLTAPSTAPANSKCAPVWRLGTCCNENELRKEATTYESNVQKLLDSYRTNLEEMIKKFSSKVKKDPSIFSNLWSTNPQLKFINDLLVGGIDMYSNFAKVCWTYMNKVRNSAMCSVCAADSDNYFQGERALISQGDCSTMLDQCTGYFNFVLNMVRGLNFLDEAMKRPGIKIKGEMEDMGNALVKRLIPAIKANEVLSQLEASSQGSAQAKIAVCNSLYTLNGQRATFLEKAAPLFDMIAQKSDDIAKGLVDFAKSNGANLGRKLKGNNNWNFSPIFTETVFDSDIMVAVGNFLGAFRPMNLSLCFP